MIHSLGLQGFFLVCCAGALVTCSGGDENDDDGGNGDDEMLIGQGPGATDEGAFLDPPSESSSGVSPGSPVTNATDLNSTNACAAIELGLEQSTVDVPMDVTVTTEKLSPVALYVVLDNSLSMDDSPSSDETGEDDSKWNQAVDALTLFARDPDSAGIDVALTYFNASNGNGGGNLQTTDEQCDGSLHSNPDVALGELPSNADAIVDSLQDSDPTGTTPTVGALLGGVTYCEQYMEDSGEPCVVVLVTDGQPRGCGLDSSCGNGGGMDCVDPDAIATLTPIAEDGFDAGVRVFTVGMAGVTDDGFDLLNAVAAAGGTDCTPGSAGGEACDVSETGSEGLLNALNAIRDSVSVTETMTDTTTVITTETLPCQWEIPDPPANETFDPALVNIVLSVDGGATETLGAVADGDDCDDTGGWFYDDPDSPTTIHACSASCDRIESASTSSVEVLFGCASVPVGQGAEAR